MSIKQQKYLQMCQLHIALSENHSTSKEMPLFASIYRNMLIIDNVNCALLFEFSTSKVE